MYNTNENITKMTEKLPAAQPISGITFRPLYLSPFHQI